MKKIILAAVIVIAFAGYAVYQHRQAKPAIVIPGNAGNGSASPGGQPPAAAPAGAAQTYKDGTYVGDDVNAYYGKVQVQVTVAGGKITDVQFLDYPKDRGNTLEISQSSMPVLKSEAIASQSANVQIVSGATQTSQGFQQSLQSALNQALAG
ncbi:MAG TPA: FMN-binding protein [Patescibacteria group bacterium]|nr:FMN-binding protein [Patescibacteria group bacterium]